MMGDGLAKPLTRLGEWLVTVLVAIVAVPWTLGMVGYLCVAFMWQAVFEFDEKPGVRFVRFIIGAAGFAALCAVVVLLKYLFFSDVEYDPDPGSGPHGWEYAP